MFGLGEGVIAVNKRIGGMTSGEAELQRSCPFACMGVLAESWLLAACRRNASGAQRCMQGGLTSWRPNHRSHKALRQPALLRMWERTNDELSVMNT
jgi:hypothetical protein